MTRWLLLAGVIGCGGTETEPPDATSDATVADVVDAGCPDGEFCFPDTSLVDHGSRPDAELPDAAYTPTCADVGRFVGVATCCDGGYCSGGCFAGVSCYCQASTVGCPWPLVCCLDPSGCVAAQQCNRWWN